MCSHNCGRYPSHIADCPHSGARVRIPLRKPGLASLDSYCPNVTRTLKIAYNNESMPYFDLKQDRANIDTLEGAVLQIFIDRHDVTPVYMYGNYEWGSLDPETGLWSGVVGMVGYDKSDVGVSIISYTLERNTFIDYSPAVGTDSMVWVTKPPQKISGASNLIL